VAIAAFVRSPSSRVHVRMVEFFGGAPALFVPDNLWSGVTKACRYEPVINRTYLEFARRLGTGPAHSHRTA